MLPGQPERRRRLRNQTVERAQPASPASEALKSIATKDEITQRSRDGPSLLHPYLTGSKPR